MNRSNVTVVNNKIMDGEGRKRGQMTKYEFIRNQLNFAKQPVPAEPPYWKSLDQSSERVLAADVVSNIRNESANLALRKIMANDRDGSLLALHNLWSMIPAFWKMLSADLVELLAESVVYQDKELIIISKPYHLASHGGPEIRQSVAHVLKQLALRLGYRELILCHRLDQNVTGCLMLASNEKKAAQLHNLIELKQIDKRYWCIVRGVPTLPEASVRIPIRRLKVGGRYKTVPVSHKPRPDGDDIPRIDSLEAERKRLSSTSDCGEDDKAVEQRPSAVRFAQTDYRVIATGLKCALLECSIRAGFQHQIRCHLGLGLNHPIIGDHKYSEFNKYVPQRLPAEVLHNLGIRSQKVRYLPMYLHAKDIRIENYFELGKPLYVQAPLPKFFRWTMNKLKIAIR